MKKLSYFKVSDFADLLREGQEDKGRSVEWEMPMETVLDCMLQGQKAVSVYREGKYMGSFQHGDLIQAVDGIENQGRSQAGGRV